MKNINITKVTVEKRYDPSQPRAPKGSPDGGQWVAQGSAAPADGADDPRLTKQQRDRIAMLRRKFAPRDGYEFKENEVEVKNWGDYGWEWLSESDKERVSCFLKLTTGLIRDEDSMASVFARDTRRFQIGKRGGVKTFNGKRWVPGITWDKAY